MDLNKEFEEPRACDEFEFTLSIIFLEVNIEGHPAYEGFSQKPDVTPVCIKCHPHIHREGNTARKTDMSLKLRKRCYDL